MLLHLKKELKRGTRNFITDLKYCSKRQEICNVFHSKIQKWCLSIFEVVMDNCFILLLPQRVIYKNLTIGFYFKNIYKIFYVKLAVKFFLPDNNFLENLKNDLKQKKSVVIFITWLARSFYPSSKPSFIPLYIMTYKTLKIEIWMKFCNRWSVMLSKMASFSLFLIRYSIKFQPIGRRYWNGFLVSPHSMYFFFFSFL